MKNVQSSTRSKGSPSRCYTRAQELCESRGGSPGLTVPNSPYDQCGRKSTLNLNMLHRFNRSTVRSKSKRPCPPRLIADNSNSCLPQCPQKDPTERVQVQCCFTSAETDVRTIWDGKPRTATSTFTQLLSSGVTPG